MDVVLIDDKTIARNKHASVTYDPKGNAFYVTPEGGNTVYVAGELAGEAVKLSAGDVITIGKTELVFIPYCEEERKENITKQLSDFCSVSDLLHNQSAGKIF